MAEDIPNHGLGITPADALRAIFRFKWLIAFCFLVGIVAGGAIYVTQKPAYRSTAKLVVRYVTERRDMVGIGEVEQIRAPDARGDNIINTEMEILSSWDLAVKVAEAIGPARILAHSDVGTNGASLHRAARVVAKGIKMDIPRNSNIIIVSYDHPDPGLAPLVLRGLLDQYRAKHFDIHRAVGNSEFLDKQTVEMAARLRQTEEELRNLRNQANLIAFDDTRRFLAEQLNQIRKAIYEAEALYAERKAAMVGTINEPVAPSATNESVAVAAPAPEEVALYKLLCDRLLLARQTELALLGTFQAENPLVIDARKQITEIEKKKTDLEEVSPGLAYLSATAPMSIRNSAGERVIPPQNDAVLVAAVEARIRVLTNQLAEVMQEAKAFEEVEDRLFQLQGKKQREEANYRNFATRLEQARIDSALDSSRMSNIVEAQAPSPPVQDSSVRMKNAIMVLAGGLGLGFALALLLELLVDQSVRKPAELEKKFHLPVFLSIPALTFRNSLRGGPQKLLSWAGSGNDKNVGSKSLSEPQSANYSLWEAPPELRPFCEALRDRLALHFENVTRRPKVVGLSGCAPGSGTTTLAAGLAAALSETGDGNVLLVDLNLDRGTAHPFYCGKPLCGLADTLEQAKRSEALVQNNLFLATGTESNGSVHPVFSKKVVDLMPRMRASDFDYIIFDLPPISATSITFRLAGHMDLMLMVIESAKTQRHMVKEAMSLLGHAKAKVGAILNKHRSAVPLWLPYAS